MVFLSNKRERGRRSKWKIQMQEKNFKLYQQLKEIYDKYTTEKSLDEIHHDLSSQKNESMNRSVMKFAPKYSCFGKTMSLFSRISMAVSINSIGQKSFYTRLFPRLGIAYGGTCDLCFVRADRRFQVHARIKQSAKTRRIRAARNSTKWREELARMICDAKEGKTYKTGSGVGLLSNNGTNTLDDLVEPTTLPSNRTKKRCRCGSTEHARTSSLLCPLNSKYNEKQKKARQSVTHLEDNKQMHTEREDSSKWDELSLT